MSQDVIKLHVVAREITISAKRGDVITRDQIYSRAGFTARSGENSLMHCIHLGPNGELDKGVTAINPTKLRLQNFFRYENDTQYHYVGDAYDITLNIEIEPEVVEQPEPEIHTEPEISFDFGPASTPDLEVPQPQVAEEPKPAPGGFAALMQQQVSEPEAEDELPGLQLTEETPTSLRYELEVDLGAEPGLKVIPTLSHKFKAPKGKEVTGITLMGFPYAPDGTLFEMMDITGGGIYIPGDEVNFSPEGGFAAPLPFGYEDGGVTVQGIWYGFFVELQDAQPPEPKGLWGAVSKPSPQSIPAQPQSETVQQPPVQDQGGLGDIWGDSEPSVDTTDFTAPRINLDDDDEIRLDLNGSNQMPSQPPSYQEQAHYQPQAQAMAFDAQQTGPIQSPLLPEEDGGMDVGDIDLDSEFDPPAPQKKGLGLKGGKAAKAPKAPKAPKPPKEPGKGSKKIAIIAGSLLAVIGLGIGGFMYRSSGIKQAAELRTQITETNKQLAEYLSIEGDFSTEEVIKVTELTDQADKQFKAFEPSNLFAKLEEKRLYDNTNKIITQLQEKVNASQGN